MADPDIKYKVTAVNRQGDVITLYTTEEGRRSLVRSLSDTYGGCEVEALNPEDVPEGIEPL